MRPFALLAASLILASSASRAQSIDAFNPPAPTVPPTSLAMQADGKMILAGNFLTMGAAVRTRIARLNVDGSLDASFADPNVNGQVKAVAVQSDGKLLIGGSFDSVHGQPRHYLARIDPDGTLDTNFGDANLDGTVWAIAIQPGGKILAGGDFTHIGATAQNYFARFEENGAFDASFDNPQLCCNVVRAVALQPDGHVLIGGAFSQAGGVSGHFYLARYSSEGTFDPTFPNVSESIVLLANDLVVAPDGSVLLTGSGAPSMRRLHADGTLDTSFNAVDTDGNVTGVALQPNGKLLIAGNFQQVGGQPRHALARLNANGSLDATFADLHFSLDATHPNGSIYGLAAQADGAAVAIGNFSLIGAQPRTYVARIAAGEAATHSFTGTASGTSVIVTWSRSGSGPELAQPPALMHSTDGVHFAAVGAMTRIVNGWQATLPYNVNGTPFYLQASGTTSSGADNGSPGLIASSIYVSDRIFANGFD